MNWLYIKEHYGRMFKEITNTESVGEKSIKVNLTEANEMSIEEINENITKIEGDMLLITKHTTDENKTKADLVLSWCINMIENFLYVANMKMGSCD